MNVQKSHPALIRKCRLKTRAYVSLLNPVPSLSVMVAIPFTAFLIGEVSGTTGWAFLSANIVPVGIASVVALLTQGGTMALNMSEDAHIDASTSHKSDRPIPSGVVTKAEARSLAWGTILLGIGLAFMLNSAFGVYTTVLASLGIWYNLDPLRMKERLWLNVVWKALSRGLLLYPAIFAIFGRPYSPLAWGMGSLAFLLVLSMNNTSDFADVEIDAKHGITTPAVHHGLKRLVFIMAVLAALVFVILGVFTYVGILPELWSLGILAVPIGWCLWKLWHGPDSIAALGDNHPTWYIYYVSLAGLYVLPPVQLYLFG